MIFKTSVVIKMKAVVLNVTRFLYVHQLKGCME